MCPKTRPPFSRTRKRCKRRTWPPISRCSASWTPERNLPARPLHMRRRTLTTRDSPIPRQTTANLFTELRDRIHSPDDVFAQPDRAHNTVRAGPHLHRSPTSTAPHLPRPSTVSPDPPQRQKQFSPTFAPSPYRPGESSVDTPESTAPDFFFRIFRFFSSFAFCRRKSSRAAASRC